SDLTFLFDFSIMEFPSRQNKNKTSYCVFGCSSKSCRDDTVRFYSFPTANSSFVTIKNKFGEDEVIDRRLAWIKQLKIGNEVTQSKRVCSLHFTKDDFLPSGNPNRQRIHLKKVNVPSCNLPETSLSSFNQPNLSQIHSREERRRRRSFQKQSSAIMSRSETAVICNDNDKVENEDESRAEFAAEDLSSVEVSGEYEMKISNKNITYAVKDFQDVAVQVESDFLTPKFLSFIKNDQKLSTLTGLSNFNLLNTIEKLVIQENILKNIPLCFKNFEGVRVVVDCTEIKIQKPSKLCCQ
ncbi:GSCOCG00005463001-RA-CDS, partial [Cotesia congregata]